MAEWERLSLPKYPGMTAIIDHCAQTLPVSIVALKTNDLADGTAVRKVIAWAQLMAQMECPQATAIVLEASVHGKHVYKGIAHRADGWVLSEVKPPSTKVQIKTSAAEAPKIKTVAKDTPRTDGSTVVTAKESPSPSSEVNEPLQPPAGPPKTVVPVSEASVAAMQNGAVASQAPSGGDPDKIVQGHSSEGASTKQAPKTHASEALEGLRLAAEQGNPEAQHDLGFAYYNGRYGWGLEKDLQQAAFWYQKAAEQGQAEAANDLGVMYAKGVGVAQDKQQAAHWYQKAAEQGYATSQNNLGVMYTNGQGVAQDQHQAASWFRKAAEQGFAKAQFNLGVLYFNGRGVAQDRQQAVSLYQKAAEQGYVEAQYNLGVLYFRGEGLTRDLKQAAYWYQKAAEQGYANAQYNLGLMYAKGEGLAPDEQLARTWFQKAAEQGHAGAQHALNITMKK
ncbi:TPR repeat-containing protein [Pseudomonas sp. GM78]|uniref:tetratricopeptide repeat protein n=1 Tax=Pseudomonas sp. GM78 TaxID=1144337 RepID=UPI00026F513B|nr:tetratricopeptide repeat protein [Pseudomonas sp. GM78]EJN32792.1 TPR repeat-containing protein [Pseudomonas sp. GM78]